MKCRSIGLKPSKKVKLQKLNIIYEDQAFNSNRKGKAGFYFQ